jgi:flagellar hook-associated protein 1
MSLLNVGARALLANQVALQTAGHNIANVNTPGYSRQTVVLQTVQGQFTGGGYIGQGVDVQTILRNQSELLTRQSATAGSVQSSDIVRAERLRQLQEVFSGGTAGLGAAINDMMNAFSDVVSAPTDITARTVVLTRMDETAARMRSAADRINEIQYTVTEQLHSSVAAVNSLAQQMASVNEQIARAKGNGQTPNDLLDQRDQIIRDINQYVQTTQIPADDGTVGLFVAGSQPLVLGTTATSLSVGDATAFPGSGQLKLFFNRPGAAPVEMDENVLGGGSMSGLLRFNNNDLSEGRNLLGRMAMAIGMTMNDQHNLGLTLDGALGKDLFAVPTSMPGHTNGAGVGTVSFTGPTQFSASDYEIRFTTGTAGQVVRLSDGKSTPFTDAANLATLQIDGLNFNLTTPGNPGERMLFKPFSTAAANIQSLVYSPRDLAVANPVNAAMGTSNGGTLQLSGLKATGLPNPPGLVLPANANPAAVPPILGGVQLRFTAGPPTTYDVLDRGTAPPTTIAAAQPYTPGAPISINGWEIKLQGSPNTGDTVVIGNAADPQYGDTFTRNSGNASALMGLRDVKMFDDSTLSDGYAGAIAQVGTRTQSALFAAELSTTIASNLERDRTAISGVNLDEEAARLIQYQQAYQASSKMIQIAQNIFDSLLQGLGR